MTAEREGEGGRDRPDTKDLEDNVTQRVDGRELMKKGSANACEQLDSICKCRKPMFKIFHKEVW